MVEVLYVFICLGCMALLLMSIPCFMLLKNKNTFINHTTIVRAIYLYQTDNIKLGRASLVDYSDMEEYERTFSRFYDWGYKNILPKEKFDIIKDYIPEVNRK